MHVKGAEPRQCPAEFQERITRNFGLTPYGEPKYKFAWGQSEFIRMGNVWRDVYGNERRGYRDRYQCHGTACWYIMRWRSPKEYGPPGLWYMQTWDDYSKLYMVGEYPWKGRYEGLFALNRKDFINGKLVLTHFPLTHILIDKIIPLLIEAQKLSPAEQKAALDLERQQQEKAESEATAEVMMNNLPPWYGPVSFSRQGCRTSVLDKKMEAIQKQWNRLSRGGRRPVFQKGFQQGLAPKMLN